MIDYHRVLITRAVLVVSLASLWSCGGSDLALPSNPPPDLSAVTGQNQVGTVGVALAESLVVRLSDYTGTGVSGVRVTWQPSGGGSVSASTSVTDADGRAAVQRVLGDEPGAYATSASASAAAGSPVVFLATAAPGSVDAGRSELDVSPKTLTASSGSSAATVKVTVRDRHGNPVPGVVVVLSVSGTGNKITQPTAATNAAGVATGQVSSTAAGSHTVSASANSVPVNATATIEVAAAAPSASTSEVTVPNGVAGTATTMKVRLRDAFGNPVLRTRAKLEIDISGANPKNNLRLTESNAGEYVTSYTPTKAGEDWAHLTIDGVATFGGPFRSLVEAGPAAAATTIATVDPDATLFDPLIEIQVDPRDAFGNLVRRAGEGIAAVAVFGATRTVVPVTFDAKTGLYTGVFQPRDFGTYSVEITVNGVQVPGSPFPVIRRI